MTDANELRALEADPFVRLLALLAPLMLGDDAPLRDAMPGVWPTVGDLRALIASREAAVKPLSELLAVIHRDGGHYEDEHGTEAAIAEAMRLSSERIEPLGDDAGLVEQADRDAAADFMDECAPYLGDCGMKNSVHLALRQAFARHRTSANATLTRELADANAAAAFNLQTAIENAEGMGRAREAMERARVQISGGLCYFKAEAKHAQLQDADKTLAAALSATTDLGGTKSRAATRIETFTRELAALPCDTKSVDDMEVGCCAPCRARAALAQDTTPVDAKKKG